MQSRLPFVFIIATLMLDSIGIGIIIPVMPELLSTLTGDSISQVALWGGFMATTYAVMQFVCGPTIGNLSDRFGRRPILLTSVFVMGLDYILLTLADTIWLLFIGRVIAGISGATFSTAAAYVADITPPEKRAANFGLIGASFGVGFVIGPVIGGFLVEFGPRAPFIVAAIFALTNFVVGYFILPETLAKEKRRKFEWKRANPLGAFKVIRSIPNMTFLVTILFVFTISHQVYPAVWSYYTIEQFSFSERMIGITLGVFGIFMAIMQGGLIRVIIPRLGETKTAKYGLILNLAVFLIVAFVSNTWFLFALLPFMAFGAVVGPALQGIMSNIVSEDSQGELQGIVSSVNALAMIFSPITMTGIFRYFTSETSPIYLPGAPFLASAVLEVTALVLLVLFARNVLAAKKQQA